MAHFGVVCLFVIFIGVCRDSYTYVGADTICGGHLNSSTGLITSPNHPSNYSMNTVCEWIIEDPNKNQMVFSVEKMSLETCSNCGCDHLEVRNGGSASSPLVGKYCGTTIPANVTSSGYQLYVKFKSDHSNEYAGFAIAWGSAIVGSYAYAGASRIHGGHFYSSSGVITSPNYPQQYPINVKREWIIEIPEHHLMVLNVKEFHLETHSLCQFDYLEIRNGSSMEKSTLIGKYCGTNITNEIRCTGDRVFLQFKTDGSNSYAGFNIEWDSDKLDCGGNFTANRGSIFSSNYPASYSPSGECNWNIRVAAGSVIQLIFVDLEFEASEQCRFDFIEIYEGNRSDTRSKKLGTYCQTINHPVYVETTSNIASVRFRSESTVADRRFQITYHTVCYNKLRGNEGAIESPNFPNKYPHRENCSWIIEAPTGLTLNLTFSQFDLEGKLGNSCGNDYLEITEGKDDVPNRRIGKFCNSNRPPSIIVSTEQQVFLHFYSDASVSGDGFRLQWIVNVHNATLPSSRSCLLSSPAVTRRDDYTYTLGNGGHKLHTQAATWNEGRKICEEEGGHLAIINSVAELNVITKLLRNSPVITGSQYPGYVSIGFHDLYSEGQFVTIHGQPLSTTGFSQWEDGQPDNYNDSENCGGLSINGKLNDINCGVEYGFVCEIPIY